jgi:uncharacterized membrane protein|tara:strand:+ start:58906 stop:59595 length:690 start_codon:yes stop_codon:yes gene_type:complete
MTRNAAKKEIMIQAWAKWTAGTAIALMWLASAISWFLVPDNLKVPVHYNAAGQVDRYGSKLEALLVQPTIALAIFALIAVLARVEPRYQNLMRSRKALSWTLAGTVVLLAVIHATMLLGMFGVDVPILLLVNLGVGALLIVVGNFLPKTRSNFALGVRTRWTLSSDYSWRLTHLWAGRGFVLIGVAILITTLLAPAISLYVIVGGTILLVLAITVASWLWWRDDPARAQ